MNWREVQSASFCHYRQKALRRLQQAGWAWASDFVHVLASERLDWQPGVYVLWRGYDCWYVGASGQLGRRIVSSLADRCLDDPDAPWCWSFNWSDSPGAAFRGEAWAIGVLNPAVNRLRPAFSVQAASDRWSVTLPCNVAGQRWLGEVGRPAMDAILDRAIAPSVRSVAAAVELQRLDGLRASRRAAAAVRLGDMIEARHYRFLRDNPAREGRAGLIAGFLGGAIDRLQSSAPASVERRRVA